MTPQPIEEENWERVLREYIEVTGITTVGTLTHTELKMITKHALQSQKAQLIQQVRYDVATAVTNRMRNYVKTPLQSRRNAFDELAELRKEITSVPSLTNEE